MMLSESDLKEEMITSSKVFHFGTLSMTDEICKKATIKAIQTAMDAGKIITFDPNLREPLWGSLDEAKEQIAYGMGKCNMLKISDNEITWFTGIDDYEEGARFLQKKYPNIDLLLVSLGKDGSLAYSRSSKAFAPAFIQPNTIETTGAGDTFCGCVIHYILENIGPDGGIRDFSEGELKEMLTFANAGASLITTRKGALRVMPNKEEIEAMIKEKTEV